MVDRFDESLGGYVPAIPEPFEGQWWFGLGKYSQCCACGMKFKGAARRIEYEAHYALSHVDDGDEIQRRNLDECWTECYGSDIEGVAAYHFTQRGGKFMKISAENMREMGWVRADE